MKQMKYLLLLWTFFFGTSVIFAQTCGGFVKVESNGFHVVGLKTDGSLWTWGLNASGEIGDGTTTIKSSPVRIGSDNNWASVCTGQYHTVALKSNGTLWAWGRNTAGQLGLGSGSNSYIPLQMGTDTNWASITAGGNQTVAIKTDGTLWAWGDNSWGQLGDGTTTNRIAPVRIGVDTNWKSVSTGSFHTLAIKTDGSLWGWGRNVTGAVGDGTTTNRTAPVRVGTDMDWSKISAGGSHTLAIKLDGTLWSWGQNFYGALGNGGFADSNIPIRTGSATNWININAGANHSVGLKTDGSLWAWGINNMGQVGDNSTTNRFSPIRLGSSSIWTEISASLEYSHAIASDSMLYAWGDNSSGQIGDGTNTTRYYPILISFNTPVAPTVVTPVNYTQNDVATALTASSAGMGLLWYTTATGGIGSATAPIPSTSNVGTISYWLSSHNAIICESGRVKIDVIISSPPAATHLNFDGIDDHVSAPIVINPVLADVTLEAYIYPSDITGVRSIIKNSGKLNLSVWNGYLFAEVWHNGASSINLLTFKSVDLISLNTWTHIAVTWNNVTDSLLMYINGILVSTTQNTTSNIINEFAIGGNTNGDMFKGNIDEVRIFDRILSQTNIQETMNCELQTGQTGLVAYYKFNQGLDNFNNSSVSTATATIGSNGVLNNFALTGLVSNWKSGSPITIGDTCATLAVVNFDNNSNFKIYPNPTQNGITVELQNLSNAKLEIYDVNGRLIQNQILNQIENKININKLLSGIYLFKMSSNEGTVTEKVIKQ